MKTKFLYLIITFILVILKYGEAQQSPFKTILGSGRHETIGSVIEDFDGNYVVCGVKGKPFELIEEKAIIYKIGPKGDSLFFAEYFTPGDSLTCFTNIFQLPDSGFIAIGKKGKRNKCLWTVRLDKDFNAIKSNTYPAPGDYYYFSIKSIIKPNGNIIAFGNCYSYPNPSNDPNIYSLFELSSDGDSLYAVYSDTTGSSHFYNTNILYNEKIDKYYGLFDFGTGYIMKFNPDFSEHSLIDMPGLFYGLSSGKWLNDTNMIIVGIFLRNTSPPQDDDICAYLLDTNCNPIDHIFLGDEDIVDYDAWNQGVDFKRKDIIFIGGTTPFPFSTFPPIPSQFLLSVVDSAFNLKWQERYGGDAYYELFNVLATRDGGCLMVGARYDYLTQEEEHDIFLKKVYPPDSLYNNINDLNQEVISVELFPNPGKDYISIKCKKYSIKKIEFFNYNGIQILEKRIKDNGTIIHVQNIPPGIYIYRVTANNNSIHTGKWIKQ